MQLTEPCERGKKRVSIPLYQQKDKNKGKQTPKVYAEYTAVNSAILGKLQTVYQNNCSTVLCLCNV
jgi:hypothetical protein